MKRREIHVQAYPLNEQSKMKNKEKVAIHENNSAFIL
jgi:hypothetical protein